MKDLIVIIQIIPFISDFITFETESRGLK